LTILLLISSRVGLTQPSLTDHTKAASGTKLPLGYSQEFRSLQSAAFP